MIQRYSPATEKRAQQLADDGFTVQPIHVMVLVLFSLLVQSVHCVCCSCGLGCMCVDLCCCLRAPSLYCSSRAAWEVCISSHHHHPTSPCLEVGTQRRHVSRHCWVIQKRGRGWATLLANSAGIFYNSHLKISKTTPHWKHGVHSFFFFC